MSEPIRFLCSNSMGHKNLSFRTIATTESIFSKHYGSNTRRLFSTSPFRATRHANIGKLNLEIQNNFAHLLSRPLPSSILSDDIELHFELTKNDGKTSSTRGYRSEETSPGTNLNQLGFFGIPTVKGKLLYNICWRIISGMVRFYINTTNNVEIDYRKTGGKEQGNKSDDNNIDIPILPRFSNKNQPENSNVANIENKTDFNNESQKNRLIANLELAILDYKIENPPRSHDSSSSHSTISSSFSDKASSTLILDEQESLKPYSKDQPFENGFNTVRIARHAHGEGSNRYSDDISGVTRIIVKWRTEYNWRHITLTNESPPIDPPSDISSFTTHSLPKNSVSGIFIFELDKECRQIEKHFIKNVEKIDSKETGTEITMGEFGLNSMAFNAASLTSMERLSRVLFCQKAGNKPEKKA
ncbi:hypothetical protein NADFUDRAFT_39473 [Nadsonia fulvescens var. elongata DSM 6958]|uniref:Uncharacterized protein n=1 Tax=Nadsonia fulvescens var. elongata DSM 6958 TaxID=857566 RepID=A0A1E3PRW7_9ASCO|nr:hypothetical protein NADFUDRAFT_39473 [Nadsonia fulvescens var. elongata DSM 6958]